MDMLQIIVEELNRLREHLLLPLLDHAEVLARSLPPSLVPPLLEDMALAAPVTPGEQHALPADGSTPGAADPAPAPAPVAPEPSPAADDPAPVSDPPAVPPAAAADVAPLAP